MKKLKTITKAKIFLSIVCTIIAIFLCIGVCHEWKAQGCDMPFSLAAGCVSYIIGAIVLYMFGKDVAEWIDYWFFNGDEYYKGRKK